VHLQKRSNGEEQEESGYSLAATPRSPTALEAKSQLEVALDSSDYPMHFSVPLRP